MDIGGDGGLIGEFYLSKKDPLGSPNELHDLNSVPSVKLLLQPAKTSKPGRGSEASKDPEHGRPTGNGKAKGSLFPTGRREEREMCLTRGGYACIFPFYYKGKRLNVDISTHIVLSMAVQRLIALFQAL